MILSLSFSETESYSDEYLNDYITLLEIAIKEAYVVKHYRKCKGVWSIPKPEVVK